MAGEGLQATGFSYPLAAVDRCVYLDGYHVYAGQDCPHNDPDPDQPPTGWTVQQGIPPQ